MLASQRAHTHHNKMCIFSDRSVTGMNRFSPQFYNCKEQTLPFTDSDGLYDFPSSDGRGNGSKIAHPPRRSSVRRRDRKLARASGLSIAFQSRAKSNAKTLSNEIVVTSPTKLSSHMDLNAKETSAKAHTSTRKSPKRRPMQRHVVISSSSSTESLTSAKGNQARNAHAQYRLDIFIFNFLLIK